MFLYETLSMLKTESVMDYCEEFDEIISILSYCNTNVKPFNKVHFRGGNEVMINELTSRLLKLLVDRKLVDSESNEFLPDASPILRKIVMFLFMNTDATYKYNLREDLQFAHVLEVCQLLPKFLLVTLIWDLRLDTFFYEALAYAPCWFAFQYFEIASDTMKHIDDPYKVLDKVEHLVRSLCISMARSELRIIDAVDRKIINGKLYDYTMNLLRQFYTPDAEKFKQFSKLQFYRYSGFAMKHLLQMVLHAFDFFETPELFKPMPEMQIYEICLQNCPIVSKESEASAELKQHQEKVIKALLNSLQYNVYLVKLDVFIYWVEIDVSGSQNLQSIIGSLAYTVGERMEKNASFAHDVIQQLKPLSIRPKTLAELGVRQILNDLDGKEDPTEKKSFLNELFNRMEIFGNEECLETVNQHIKLMTIDNIRKCLDFIKLDFMRRFEEIKQELEEEVHLVKRERLESPEHDMIEEPLDIATRMDEIDINDYDQLIEIVLLALSNLNTEEILEMLIYQTKHFGNSSSVFGQRDDFNQRATAFLNKGNSDFDFQQFCLLCFENPKQMWYKFFQCACNSKKDVQNFCATVKRSRPFSDFYFNWLLELAMSDHKRMHEQLFPNLLCEIYFVLYYPEHKTEFLKQFINKQVTDFLDGQHFGPLSRIIKALNNIEKHGETQSHKPQNFGEITAPVLLMVAQIMDKSRWDLITYTEERDLIVTECIEFIQNTSKKFLPIATEKDRKWITKVIKDSYRPITQYYFQKFSLAPDQPAADFDRFLIRLEIEDKSEAEMFLIINMVRCTRKEIKWLARSERLQPHMSDVMLILSGVVKETDSYNAFNNYFNCICNYTHAVLDIILPKIQNDTKKMEKLTMKLLKIIESSPPQNIRDVIASIDWLILEIINKYKCALENANGGVDGLEGSSRFFDSVRQFVDKWNCPRSKEMFLSNFEEILKEKSDKI